MIHDTALQELPVVFCLDRAGLVGEDGPTHHGVFDLAYFRQVPGVTVMAPRDAHELGQMLRFALSSEAGPVAIRYPRGAVPEESSPFLLAKREPVLRARPEMIREGHDVLILAVGSMAYPAYQAALLLEKEGVDAAVMNARFVKPLDAEAILEASKGKSLLLTVEEGVAAGGFGGAVLELFASEPAGRDRIAKVRTLGVPDRFIEHGKREELLDLVGLTAEKIAAEVLALSGSVKSEAKHYA